MNKIFKIIGAAFLIAAPFLFWYLPYNFFNDGPDICPSKVFFNRECLGCGITRACQHIHHLKLSKAIEFNWLVVIIYPLIWLVYIYIWGKILNKRWLTFLDSYFYKKDKLSQ